MRAIFVLVVGLVGSVVVGVPALAGVVDTSPGKNSLDSNAMDVSPGADADAGAGSPAATGAAAPTYRYEYRLPCRESEQFESPEAYGCSLEVRCGEDDRGVYYQVTRVTIATGHREDLGLQCLTPEEAGPTLAQIREAFERTPVPDSKLLLQPPDGVTLVNFRTIFRTEARPFTREFLLLGFQVELEVTPTVFRWVHGDGTEQSSDWSGREYSKLVEVSSKNYIVHEYATKGVVAPRVDTVWSARFRVDGGAWLPVNGTVTRRGAPVDLRVAEAVPMLVADDG